MTTDEVRRAADGATIRPDRGSFRDPLSRVFVGDEAVFRGLTAEALEDFGALAESSFFAAALERGDIVATERVDDTADVPGDWAGVLRHDRIGVLSYPYEWSFEMLRDAARLQLELTREALADKLITKDASAFNIQFVGAKPVFIDVGSFERLRRGEPWAGYRQFCELFLNPLYVQALRDVPFQPLLRGRLDGITPGSPRPSSATRAASARRVHPCAPPRPRRAQVRGRGSRRRARRAQARRLRTGVDRRPAAQPPARPRPPVVEATRLDVVGVRRARSLHGPRPRGQVVVRGHRGHRSPAERRARPRRQRRALLASPSMRGRDPPSPSTPTSSSSTASMGSSAPMASGGSSRSSSISPTRHRRSAGVVASAHRSSIASARTSCCASPSSTTWR